MKEVYYLTTKRVRQNVITRINQAPDGHRVEIREPLRSPDQNAAMWPILEAFAKQVKWPVNGEMVYMSDEEWKDVFTAAFENETIRLAQGLNGGVVMLGKRTSKYGKRKFAALLEFIHAEAANRGVVVYDQSETTVHFTDD